jgi:hypothetical protein
MSISDALDYQETIALLQEEIVRLESELRARDDGRTEPGEPAAAGPDDELLGEGMRAQVASLTAELAAREETIHLLLEQARLFEQAEAADQANWEQLNRWVEELEQRVEQGGGHEAADLRGTLEAERRRFDAERHEIQTERRAWDTTRRGLEAEVEKLRETLAQAARQPGKEGDAVLEALEQENRQLREAASENAQLAAAAAEADALRQRIVTVETELARVEKELRQTVDDLQRERNEHTAIVSGLRSQIARDSLKRQEEHVMASVGSEETDAGDGANLLSVDERIRAFRQHLRDIHEQEEHERAQKRLSARLSRLWHKTGPCG